MEKRELAALFVCNMIPYTVGNGLLPLLPVYAGTLGAPSTVVGFYLAFSYVAIAAGSMLAGSVGRAMGGYRRALLLLGVLAVPLSLALGWARDVVSLSAVTAALWFAGGGGLTLTNILLGLAAPPAERGRAFGILTVASPLGGLLGGLTVGLMADLWGYRAMFAVVAVYLVLWPLASLLVRERIDRVPESAADAEKAPPARLGRGFWLLFAAQVLAHVAGFSAVLGRSLSMDALGFPVTAISISSAIASAVSLPVSPLLGAWSDRVGRRWLVALGYGMSLASLLVLTVAAAVWHFWVVVTLHACALAMVFSVGSALVADLVPRRAVDVAMSWFSATSGIGAVAGFALTGYAVGQLGIPITFGIAALLPLVSMFLLYLSGRPARRVASGAIA